jgi:hypothetical protein
MAPHVSVWRSDLICVVKRFFFLRMIVKRFKESVSLLCDYDYEKDLKTLNLARIVPSRLFELL